MNRLTTALIVLAVVAGPPLATGVWLRHHPWRPPTRAQTVVWAQQPLTTGTIIGGCLAVAGLGWLLFVIFLTRQALAGLRRRLRRRRHLPVPTPAQMTASSMAGVAAFVLPAAHTGHPAPVSTTAGTPPPADPAAFDHHARQLAHDQPGIDLPGGGWIPYRSAAAITALAAGVWLHRRRLYRPDPQQPCDHHHDADLQPLPDTVNAICTAVTDEETGRYQPPPPLLLDQPLPEGTLLLTGPGAVAAARGLLVTATLTGTFTVAVRPGDLPTLLPPTDRTAKPPLSNQMAETGDRPGPGTLIILGEGPTSSHHWHVTADGTVTGTGLAEPRRLCTLTRQTAADLLTLASVQPAPTAAPKQTPSASRRLPAATPAPVEPAVARLTLLGGCQLTVHGTPVHLRRSAAVQILAYLAIHSQGATRTDLIHAIWPHLSAATIVQRLHTTLADLRRQLRPLLEEEPLTLHDDRYRLNTHAITTDLQEWQAAVHAMSHAVGTTARLHACRQVAALDDGELAAGRTWAWITPVREQLRRTMIDAYAALAEHADIDESLHWLRRAITVDPDNEPIRHHAADLLTRTGDNAGADDLIKRLHRRLPDDRPPPP